MKEKLEISRELVCFPILATEKNFCTFKYPFPARTLLKKKKKFEKNAIKMMSKNFPNNKSVDLGVYEKGGGEKKEKCTYL